MIKKLTQANPVLFTKWRGGGVSRASAMCNIVPLTYEGIRGLLAEKKTNQDEDYPEYSFDGDLWNARPDGEIAAVRFALGSQEEEKWSNFCQIDLPYQGTQYEYYCQGANRQVLIQLLEEHWHPEEIKLFFSELDEN